MAALRDFLARTPNLVLADLAWTLNTGPAGKERLAVVAGSMAALVEHLDRAGERLADDRCRQIRDLQGCYYFAEPLYPRGRLAVLFPGEGSQYVNMLADLLPHFPEVRGHFEQCDRQSLPGGFPRQVSEAIFLPPDAPAEDQARAEQDLWQLDNATASTLIADWSLHRLLQELGVSAHAMAGHSCGEFTALTAAGCLEHSDALIASLFRLAQTLNRQHVEGHMAEFTLLAAGISRKKSASLIERAGPTVQVAMDNCPHQVVLAGPPAVMEGVENELRQQGVICTRLPFHRPYHTPLFEPFLPPVGDFFAAQTVHSPRTPVYSCVTGRPFPSNPDDIRRLAAANWAARVEFVQLIESMYADGVRLFIEAGPRSNLTSFVEDTLRGRPFLAIPMNVARRSGLTQINHLVAQLATQHVPLRIEHLFARRNPRRVEWEQETFGAKPSSREGEAPRPPITTRQPSSLVMQQYLGVMEQFLDLQREVTEQYLSRRQRPAPSAPAWPLLGTVVRHLPGRELVLRRTMDLAEDLYASDHTLGARNASALDPHQHGLPFMPMALSLEMMAEAASVLVPGRVVVGMKKVRLQRWIPFDDEPTTLELTARVCPESPGEVSITIHDLGNAARPGSAETAAVHGTVLLADRYPEPPPVDGFPLSNEGPCPFTPHQLYGGEYRLFHGPLFQALVSTDRQGDEGIEGHLQALPHDGLFRSTPEPRLLTDPLLIDASTHLLGCWHLGRANRAGRVVLPYEIGSVSLHGPPPPTGTRMLCRVRIVRGSQRQVSHRIDLIGPDGRLWCRLDPAEYWRFYWPDEFVEYFRHKERFLVSRPWVAGCLHLEPPADLCHSVKRIAIARVSLTAREWRHYRLLRKPEEELTAWLFGRLVAKDAVRAAWYERHGQRLFPADIELPLEGEGCLQPHYRDPAQLDGLPAVCLARAGKGLVALATFDTRVGLAVVRLDDAEESVLAPEERKLLAAWQGSRDEGIAWLLAARGAVGKALGPTRMVVRSLNHREGTLTVAPAEGSAAPHLVRIHREGDLVIGVTHCAEARG
jgi:malonyl CoA-acyl carrier protein transacylase